MKKMPIYIDFDQEFWETELADFLPERLFDAHCHLWRDEDAGNNQDPNNGLRLPVDGKTIQHWSQQIYAGRQVDFYYLGTPVVGCDLLSHNEFLLQESKNNKMPAAALVTPDLNAEQVDRLFQRGFAGLKPYKLFAQDPVECNLTDYLPEAQMEVANHYHGKITLHLSKRLVISNPKNQQDLLLYTKKYPNIQWILAHCACGFNSIHLEKSMEMLKELGDNVWYDLSAVCDPYSHYLLFKHLNRQRLLWGTDNIAAGSMHGNYIAWGKGWAFQAMQECPHCQGDATLVVYEQLRAIKHAAEMAQLTSPDLHDIFFKNAQRLFGEESSLDFDAD